MEAKFTRGPLSIKGPSLGEMANDAGGDYAILDEEGLIIGESFCRVSTDEIRPARENATLWAAAPEMYEALEWLMASRRVPDTEAGLEAENKGRLALYKARGES